MRSSLLLLCIVGTCAGFQVGKQHKNAALQEPIVDMDCEQYYDDALPAIINCPGGCLMTNAEGYVYGSNPYSADSYACERCIHAGVVDQAYGGQCYLYDVGERTFTSTTVDGFTSDSWNSPSAAICVGDGSSGDDIPDICADDTTTSSAAPYTTSSSAAPVTTSSSAAPYTTPAPPGTSSTTPATTTTTAAPGEVAPKIEPAPDAPIMHTGDWIHAIVLGPDEVPPSLPGNEDVDEDMYGSDGYGSDSGSGSGYEDYGSGYEEGVALVESTTVVHKKRHSHSFDAKAHPTTLVEKNSGTTAKLTAAHSPKAKSAQSAKSDASQKADPTTLVEKKSGTTAKLAAAHSPKAKSAQSAKSDASQKADPTTLVEKKSVATAKLAAAHSQKDKSAPSATATSHKKSAASQKAQNLAKRISKAQSRETTGRTSASMVH